MSRLFTVEVEDASGFVVVLTVPAEGHAPAALVAAAYAAKPPPRRVTMWVEEPPQ